MYILGIVGFGVVGQAALRFFIKRPDVVKNFLNIHNELIHFMIWDEKTLPEEIKKRYAGDCVSWVDGQGLSLQKFLEKTSNALVSPGVGLGEIAEQILAKVFCELDLFKYCFLGEAIAITGSLGKTTVTKLIHKIFTRYQILQQEKTKEHIKLGGNVGVGMLDLLSGVENADWAVLELSSFQLERSRFFAPRIGIFLNLYPNHLDRHGDLEGYFFAKAKLAMFQSHSDVLILGEQLFDKALLGYTLDLIKKSNAYIVIAGVDSVHAEIIRYINRPFSVWSCRSGWLVKEIINQEQIEQSEQILQIADLPPVTFLQNWVVIMAALDAAGVPLAWLQKDLSVARSEYVPDDHKHRVEFVATRGGVMFYNDSKSTVQEATIAAVNQFATKNCRIHVIVGGLSKGVDRRNFVFHLKKQQYVVTVAAFGAEIELLRGADLYADSLSNVLQALKPFLQVGDVVLFSPGGASFDFFKNYIDRGEQFKNFVFSLFE